MQAEDGIEALESLQFHENETLYRIANKLVDDYYGEDYDEKVESNTGSNTESYPPWRCSQKWSVLHDKILYKLTRLYNNFHTNQRHSGTSLYLYNQEL